MWIHAFSGSYGISMYSRNIDAMLLPVEISVYLQYVSIFKPHRVPMYRCMRFQSR